MNLKHLFSGYGVALLIVSTFNNAALAQTTGAEKVLHVGIVETLFHDVPKSARQAVLAPFTMLIKNQTGITCRPVLVKDALALGRKLESNEIQLGVCNGYEFSWAIEQHKQLKPLMIAVVVHPRPVAYLVTRNDKDISDFDDLRGQKVALPKYSRPHCRLHLELEMRTQKNAAADQPIVCRPESIEEGLDDVVRGDIAAIIVDDLSLESYKEVKPGCFARLKVVEQTSAFPASPIIYHPKHMDAETLDKFRTSMLQAHEKEHNQMLMSLWRVTAFEAVPKDYDEQLRRTRKNYPASVLLDSTSEKFRAADDDE